MEQLTLLAACPRKLHSSDEGATAVEYSLLAAVIAGGLIAVVIALRTDIEATFNGLIGAI